LDAALELFIGRHGCRPLAAPRKRALARACCQGQRGYIAANSRPRNAIKREPSPPWRVIQRRTLTG